MLWGEGFPRPRPADLEKSWHHPTPAPSWPRPWPCPHRPRPWPLLLLQGFSMLLVLMMPQLQLVLHGVRILLEVVHDFAQGQCTLTQRLNGQAELLYLLGNDVLLLLPRWLQGKGLLLPSVGEYGKKHPQSYGRRAREWVASPMPGQVTHLGCGFHPLWGCVRKATHRSFFPTITFPPFHSLSSPSSLNS